MADDGQKTEQPSARRLKKAREQGQFLVSRPFVNGVQLACFVALLAAYGAEIRSYLAMLMRSMLAAAFTFDLNVQSLPILLMQAFKPGIKLALICGLGLLAMSLTAQLAVTGLGVAANAFAPNLNRLSPAGKWKQLKEQNVSEAVQATILIPVFLGIVWLVAKANYQEFLTLPLGSLSAASQRVASSAQGLLWKAAFLFFLFGAFDLIRQKRLYTNRLKMSKHELKEEHKESEGNPQLKARIRRLQRDAARRNMMKALPQATAVVVNPTHYAIAIEYRLDESGAPRVLAKGKNYLALRIKAKAEELQIPIVENPPLAQALYKSTEVGQEIPAHLYRAVAEVLAYIFRLMRK